MSIASEVSRIIDAKAGIKTAIEAKGVTVPNGALLGAYPALIDEIEAGGGDNWGKAIGDGKTYLHIEIVTPNDLTQPLAFSQTVANGVTVDWGGGSATETVSGTGNKALTHTYSKVGKYIISLTVTNGKMTLGGATNRRIFNEYSALLQPIYARLFFVEIGDNTSLGSYAFSHCYGLREIIVKSAGSVEIGTRSVQECHSLTKFDFGIATTDTISSYAFRMCYSLAEFEIPSTVTQILSSSFGYMTAMTDYYCHPTTPPTIQSTTFDIPATCKIHVPAASLAAYQAAENWSTHASKMVGDL